MKHLTLLSGLILVMTFFLTSCLEDKQQLTVLNYSDDEYAILEATLNLPSARDNYAIEFPGHISRRGVFPPFVNDAKATLGRVLFYDKKLSQNNTISCSSCHKQSHAFADDKAFSDGFNGGQTKRNSLSLAAVVNFPTYYGGGATFVRPRFMWDERAQTILEQSTMTIQDEVEMGMNLHDLSGKIGELDYYEVLFRKAYGDGYVTQERILDAIQEFINAFISADSKFDEGLNMVSTPGMEFSNFTTSENRGKQLFIQKCASCHSEDMSIPVERYANNGLDLGNPDPGIGGINGNTDDLGKFKVPPLRNIEHSAPYMHDGRFASLEEVLEHYSSNIQPNSNLDSRLIQGGQPVKMNFTEADKQDIIAFLKTLSDNTFLQAERFSDPFK
ncbi:MAG: c-type cytochrome [Saprospiraceae bacterium]|nr:c-type cytochrome [Saprospiraceae bacterium]MCB9323727.1 c-type cytochrome [Lewinellaceae bacterium]